MSASVVGAIIGRFMICWFFVFGMEICMPAFSSAFSFKVVSLTVAMLVSSFGRLASSANSMSDRRSSSVTFRPMSRLMVFHDLIK